MTQDAVPRTTLRPGWPELLTALVTAVVLYAVGGAVVFVVDPPSDPALAGITQFALSALAPAGAFAAAVLVRIRSLRPFGFRRVARGWLLAAVGLAVGCLVVGSALTLVSAPLFPGSDAVQADYRDAYAAGALSLLVSVVFGGILTPIGEESSCTPPTTSAASWPTASGSSPGWGSADGTDAGERAGGEDHLDRHLEVLRDPEREVQAGAVLATLEVAHGLVVHTERVGELPAGDPALGAQHRDPVVDPPFLSHRR
jgi:hypothetical protein